MRRVFAAFAVAGMALGFAALAQAPAPAPSPRPMLAEIMPIGGDMATSIRFYHDLLGLQSRNEDPRSHLDWLLSNPFLEDMFALKGDYRGLHLLTPPSPTRMAGEEMQIEPIEWRHPKGKPVNVKPQDVGATRIVFQTRDIDRLVGYLKGGGAKAVTTGGGPIAVTGPAGSARAILFDDGNGTFVELIQPDKLPELPGRTAGAMQSFIYGTDAAIVVGDLERSARFFQDVLGLAATVEPAFHSDPQRLQLIGLKAGQYREAALAWPGRTPQLRLVQYRDAGGKTLTPLVGDPNATLVRIFVRDMEPITAKLGAYPDARIMNVSGAPIKRGAATWLVLKVPGASTYLQLIAIPSGRVG